MDLYTAKVEAAASGDRKSCVDLLEYVRKEKIRVPEISLKVGKKLIADGGLSSDVLYTVYEQTILAALDLNDLDVVSSFIPVLKSRFPDSSRVLRLELMVLEANGKYSQADAFYRDMLQKNPSNMLIVKRQVAILKAQGKIDEAIEQLNKLLKNFQTDAGAWSELADLYLTVGNYTKAAFCFEELILTNPLNAFFHERLAEIYITIGGYDNLKVARKHLAHSLELNDTNNARALMALVVCTSTLATLKTKADKDDRELNQRLHQFALTKLKGSYNAQANSDVTSVGT
ncbi:hypothetical protein DYB37_005893 [Aphanomyces astaci]|uniref:ER membrane protein complex subunit 2 n=1 Tax=Aphanomyces astaci TaxID=112090 RepID=A0A397ANE5_APHAT|nr:hypothetical protein DYB36_002565 [Aphanomyces astaci]RHY37866.1 hypothetical protein DYB25_010744 [Aphanomyces astaci]RHY48726.1 hypothetical protein DYB30_005753 [Aphanomyces astaci]RHY51634.1 hypothetical protein DYB34_008452 [Aphanomyces astaci]RHZ03194.1 hypothetical protein DYB35_005950 [Aphanomyces astaci]